MSAILISYCHSQSCSITCGGFLGEISNYHLVKKDFACGIT